MAGATLADAFGQGFAKKWASQRLPKLVLSKQVRQDIIKSVKANFPKMPDSPAMKYLTGYMEYDVILVDTGPNIQLKDLKYGTAASVFWKGRYLSAIFSKEDFDLARNLQVNTNYVLVGKMTIKPGTKPNTEFYNFRIDGLITMDEIAEYQEI